jgi:hypothetical protein
MRTAHIIIRDAKGARLVTDGLFSATTAKYKATEPKSGETVELWASGYQTKSKKGKPVITKEK